MLNHATRGSIPYFSGALAPRLVGLSAVQQIEGLATLPKEQRLMEGYSLYPGMIGFIEVDHTGKVYFRDAGGETPQLKPVGHLYGNGDFSLNNGTRENIFTSDRMMLDPAWMSGVDEPNATPSPLGEELSRTSQAYLQGNKDLSASVRAFCNDFLRDLHGQPLTGKGSRVLIMEESAVSMSNPRAHAAIMGNRCQQIAPDSVMIPVPISTAPAGNLDLREVLLLAKDRKPLTMGGNENMPPGKIESILAKYQHYDRDFQAFESDMVAMVTGELRQFTDGVCNTVSQPNLKPGVINISSGPQGQKFYNAMIEFVYRYPNLRQSIEARFGKEQDGLEGAVARYAEHLLTHPKLCTALGDWHRITRTAAERGQFIVVSAGNHNRPESHYSGSQMVGFNLLGMSPYVISVAASDPHQQPERPEVSTLSPISSRGSVQGWHPTVAFWGANLYAEGLRGNAETGTSGAAARVSGLISLKLQQQPNLTFDQLRQSLASSSVKRPERYTAADYGYGFLDPTRFLTI